MSRPTRKSRRTRNEPPEIVPPKSDEDGGEGARNEDEEHESDDVATENAATRSEASDTSAHGTRRSKRARKPTARSVSAAAAARGRRRQAASSDDQKSKAEESSGSSDGEPDSTNQSDTRKQKRQKVTGEDSVDSNEGSGDDDEQSSSSENEEGSAAPSKASKSTRGSQKGLNRTRKSRRRAKQKTKGGRQDTDDREAGERQSDDGSGDDQQSSDSDDGEGSAAPSKASRSTRSQQAARRRGKARRKPTKKSENTPPASPSGDREEENDDGSGNDQQSEDSEDGDRSTAQSKASRSTRESAKAAGRPMKTRRRGIKKSETSKENDGDDDDGESSDQNEQSEGETSERNKASSTSKREKKVPKAQKEDTPAEAPKPSRKRRRPQKTPLPRADAIKTETLSDENLSSEGENDSDGDSSASSGASLSSKTKLEENTNASISSSVAKNTKEAAGSKNKKNEDSLAADGESGRTGKTDESNSDVGRNEVIDTNLTQNSKGEGEGDGDEPQTKEKDPEKAGSSDKKMAPSSEKDSSPAAETDTAPEGDEKAAPQQPANDSISDSEKEAVIPPDQTSDPPQETHVGEKEPVDAESLPEEGAPKDSEAVSTPDTAQVNLEAKPPEDTHLEGKDASVDEPASEEKSPQNEESKEDSGRKRSIADVAGNSSVVKAVDSHSDADADRDDDGRPEKRSRSRSPTDKADGMETTSNEASEVDIDQGKKSEGICIEGKEKTEDLPGQNTAESEKESQLTGVDQVEAHATGTEDQKAPIADQGSQHEDVTPDDSRDNKPEPVVEKGDVIAVTQDEAKTNVSNESPPTTEPARPKPEDANNGIVTERQATAKDGKNLSDKNPPTSDGAQTNDTSAVIRSQEEPNIVAKGTSEEKEEELLANDVENPSMETSKPSLEKETECETSEGDKDLPTTSNDTGVAKTSIHEEASNVDSSEVKKEEQKLEEVEVEKDNSDESVPKDEVEKLDTAGVDDTTPAVTSANAESQDQTVPMTKADDVASPQPHVISSDVGDKPSDATSNEISPPGTGEASQSNDQVDEHFEFVDASDKEPSHEGEDTPKNIDSITKVDVTTHAAAETGILQTQQGDNTGGEATKQIGEKQSDSGNQSTVGLPVSSTSTLKVAIDASDDENEQFHDAHMELPSETASPVSPADKTATDAGTTGNGDKKGRMLMLPELPEAGDSEQTAKKGEGKAEDSEGATKEKEEETEDSKQVVKKENTTTGLEKASLPDSTNLDLEKASSQSPKIVQHEQKNGISEHSTESKSAATKGDVDLGKTDSVERLENEAKTGSSTALSGDGEEPTGVCLSPNPVTQPVKAGVPNPTVGDGSQKSLEDALTANAQNPTSLEDPVKDQVVRPSKIDVSSTDLQQDRINPPPVSENSDCVPAQASSMNSLIDSVVSKPKDGPPSDMRPVPGRRSPSVHPFDRMELNRVKGLLYSAGSRVHRGRGFGRIFAEYWDAIMLRLSDRLSCHTTESCDRALNAFLRSARLRKLHNNLITCIMKRATLCLAPFAEVSNHIPRKWTNRVPRLVSNDPEPTVDSKVTPEEYTAVANQRMPIFTEAWLQLDEDEKDKIEIPRREAEVASPPDDHERDSSCIPGALVIDPLVRGLVGENDMEVSENAIWLLVVATREHASNVLKNAISYRQDYEHGSVTTPRLYSDQILSGRKNAGKKDSSTEKSADKGKPGSKSGQKGHHRCLNALDIFMGSTQMAGSSTGNIGGSVSRFALESCLHSAFAPVQLPPGREFNEVQNYFVEEITSEARKRKVAAKLHLENEVPSDLKALEPTTEPRTLGQVERNLHADFEPTGPKRPSKVKINQARHAKGLRPPEAKTNQAILPPVPPVTSQRPVSLPGTGAVSEPVGGPVVELVSGPVTQPVIQPVRGPVVDLASQVAPIQQPVVLPSSGTTAEAPPTKDVQPPPTNEESAEAKQNGPRGLGRSAKNLAALLKRAGTAQVDNENEKTTTSTNAEPSKDVPDKTIQNAKEVVSSGPVSQPATSIENTDNPTKNDDGDEDEPVRRGKGFGIKNLAAMRARATKKTSGPTEGNTGAG